MQKMSKMTVTANLRACKVKKKHEILIRRCILCITSTEKNLRE